MDRRCDLGRFSSIPQLEIITDIFLSCDVPSQIRFSSTCKTFYQLFGSEEYWKERTKQLWKEQVGEVPIDHLEKTLWRVPLLRWRDLAINLSNPSKTGNSFSTRWDGEVEIGKYSEDGGGPIGKWITTSQHRTRYGNWMNGGSGSGFVEDDLRQSVYCGQFLNSERHGTGRYESGDWRYDGGHNGNQRHGTGTMILSTLSFSSSWG